MTDKTVIYNKTHNTFSLVLERGKIVKISPDTAIRLQTDLNEAVRRYKKEKNKEVLTIQDEIVAKTIISQKKETKGYPGLKSKDFGI